MREIQQKYVQFKLIEERIEQTGKQLDLVEKQHKEIDNTLTALDRITHISANQQTLLPLAAGILVKGHITDTTELLVTVGNNITLPCSVPQARKLVEQQAKELTSYHEQLTKQLIRLSEMADQVHDELAALEKKGD